MITKFHIENFKSLANFTLPDETHALSKFTCLLGLNGAGKSTLLQALDFVGHVILGTVDGWLAQRGWEPSELVTNLTAKRTYVINFTIEMLDPNGVPIVWEARYNVHLGRCTHESVRSGGSMMMELADNRLSVADERGTLVVKYEKVDLNYRGSIMSLLQLDATHLWLKFAHETLGNLKSLELLSPQLIRQRARYGSDVGLGGEKLSAYLDTLGSIRMVRLIQELKFFYPHLQNVRVKTLRAGWKSLLVAEEYGKKVEYEAAHLSDGLLRIIAIIAQVQSNKSFFLFDEIENGINPEIIEKLVDFLRDCGRQILVTTHSPLILNYIPDDVAKESVCLLYRNNRGETKSVRYFDLPQTLRKLGALGPGEVFADTVLTNLVSEIEQQSATREATEPAQ